MNIPKRKLPFRYSHVSVNSLKKYKGMGIIGNGKSSDSSGVYRPFKEAREFARI